MWRSIVIKKNDENSIRLIKLADGHNGYIVCSDPEYIDNMAKAMGAEINYPMTYVGFLCSAYRIGKVHIEDVDYFVKTYCSKEIKIDGCTLTVEG